MDEDDAYLSDASQRGNTPNAKRSRRTPTKPLDSQPDRKTATSIAKARKRESLRYGEVSPPTAARPDAREKSSIAEDDISSNQGDNDDVQQVPVGDAELDQLAKAPRASSIQGRKPLATTNTQPGQARNAAAKLSDPIDLYSDAEGSEFDSIAEGEDFSVVSLSTLPSAQQHLNSRGPLTSQESALPNSEELQHRQPHSLDTFVPQQMNNQGRAWSHTSQSQQRQKSEDDVPASIPGVAAPANPSLLQLNVQRRTPSQLFSSPALPPLKPTYVAHSSGFIKQGQERGQSLKQPLYPDLNKRTSSVLKPANQVSDTASPEMENPSQKLTEEPRNNIFKGFGVKTRRELRAGLRLGVELAKRQQQDEVTTQNIPDSDGDIFQALALSDHRQSEPHQDALQAHHTAIPEVTYPEIRTRKQLPSPETSQDEKAERLFKGSDVRTPSTTSSTRERQEVIHHIDNAPMSEVIVINAHASSPESLDDDSSESRARKDGQSPQEDATDVWQTEARSTTHSPNASQIVMNPTVPSNDQNLRFSRQEGSQLTERKTEVFSADKPAAGPIAHKIKQEDMRYSTPSPQKENEMPNPAYTGLTNFTTEMQGIEVELPRRVLSSRHGVPSAASKRMNSLVAQEQQVRTKRKQIKLGQKRQSWKKRPMKPSARSQPTPQTMTQTSTAEAQSEQSEYSTVTAPLQHKAQAQQVPHVDEFSFSNTWQETVFSYPLLQTAAAAFSSLTSHDPSKVLLSATFQTPPTPPDKPTSLLTTHLPFNDAHYTRLRTIYMKAQRYPSLYRLQESSPCKDLVGLEVESIGWRRKLEEWELGAVDDFLRVLNIEGLRDHQRTEFGLGEDDSLREEIRVEEVVKRVFSIWVGQVQRGEVDLKDGVAGCWDKKFVDRRKEVLKRQKAWREAQSV